MDQSEYRKCPQCKRYINSVTQFVSCSQAEGCPVRGDHNNLNESGCLLEFESEEHYLEHLMKWMHGLFKKDAPEVVETTDPPVPETPSVESPEPSPVEAGGGSLHEESAPSPVTQEPDASSAPGEAAAPESAPVEAPSVHGTDAAPAASEIEVPPAADTHEASPEAIGTDTGVKTATEERSNG